MEMISVMAVNIAASIGLLVGIGLTLINLPGNIVILLLALGYAVYDGFIHITFQTLFIVFTLFIAGEVVEFIAGAVGAKKEKASSRAMLAAVVGAIIGGIIGTGLLPVIGSVLGAITGAYGASYIAEYSKAGNAEHARRVGISVMKGQAVGMIFKIVMAVGMVALIVLEMPWGL
ncbi:MAG: DUF456 domain-containing protein [Veillonellaceae bacterium]|jgi:uncharacterized protein YqgC (DUF456 family)|nr:DUF456 domain-containing protein [Veillonellaceae bacterium]